MLFLFTRLLEEILQGCQGTVLWFKLQHINQLLFFQFLLKVNSFCSHGSQKCKVSHRTGCQLFSKAAKATNAFYTVYKLKNKNILATLCTFVLESKRVVLKSLNRCKTAQSSVYKQIFTFNTY